MNKIPTRTPLVVRVFNFWRYDLNYWLMPISAVALLAAIITTLIVTLS